MTVSLDRRPLVACLLLGAAAAFGFAPLLWWPVLLVAVAAWLHLVFAATTLRSALLRGWVFGLGHFTIGNNWIQHAFDFQDKMPPVLGYAAVVLLALYLAVYPAVAAGLAWRLGRRGDAPDLGFVLVAGGAWTVGEVLRSELFTGYPWNPLAATWIGLIDFARLAAWMGSYALSGVTVIAAGALLLLATRRHWRLGAALVVVLALQWVTRPALPAPGPQLVRVVQPNVGQEGAGEPGYASQTLVAQLIQSGQPDGRPDTPPRLLLWPEGMVNYLIEDGYPAAYYGANDPGAIRRMIAARLGPNDRALVGGNAALFNGERALTGATNSVFVLAPGGAISGRYDKAHLVPYGEYLPARELLAPLGLARLVMGETDYIPGPGARSINVPGFGQAGMQICYEIIFSGRVVDRGRRPDFLFNPSNDAWFGAWGPPQHLAQARLRAIEEGLPVLRSTPNGISAVIGADGSLIGSVPRLTAGAVEVAMPRPYPPTLFARLGDWATILATALMIAGAVAFRRFSR